MVLEEAFGLAGWIEEPLEIRCIQEIHDTCGIRCHKQSPSCAQLRVAIGVFGRHAAGKRDEPRVEDATGEWWDETREGRETSPVAEHPWSAASLARPTGGARLPNCRCAKPRHLDTLRRLSCENSPSPGSRMWHYIKRDRAEEPRLGKHRSVSAKRDRLSTSPSEKPLGSSGASYTRSPTGRPRKRGSAPWVSRNGAKRLPSKAGPSFGELMRLLS